MTRLRFGVSASSSVANKVLRMNAIQNKRTHPRVALAINKSLYMDDELTGADSVSKTITFQKEVQQLLTKDSYFLEN